MEEYLQEIHADGYTGTDDDMPDAFDEFIQELEPEEWIKHADNYAESIIIRMTVVEEKAIVCTGVQFEDFWSIYPVKKGKKKSELKWNRLSNTVREKIMIDIPERKAKDSQWLGKYIPHPTTYLNGELWEDEISSSKAGGSKLTVI